MSEKKLYDLKIDPEFERIAPALTEGENEILTESLLKYGCQTPLIVWNGFIVDGHNRYRICHENNIPFACEEAVFSDKEEAKLWIVINQIGRRNLTEFEKFEIIFPYEKELKEQAEQRRREAISRSRRKEDSETGANLPPSAKSEKTREFIGRIIGISPRMVDMARTVYLKADEPLKKQLRSGEKKISAAYKSLVEKAPKEETEQSENQSPEVQPISFIDHPTEDPVTHREPEREQGSYEFVKDQVEFAIRNMIADMKVGIYCLSNEDFDKKKELKAILREGYKQAADIIDRLEKM